MLWTVHPRTRGEHEPEGYAGGLDFRFIPARAGNTSPASRHTSPPAVHPRTRGEHVLAPRWASRYGSSPHARGTPPVYRLLGRFIPARAGNTTTMAAPPTSPVHARGTHAPGRDGQDAVHPRTRGEHRTSRFHSSTAVHPRTRGEHSCLSERSFGSSPHARGTHSGFQIRFRTRGEHEAKVVQDGSRIHPRTRGEHGGGRAGGTGWRFIPARAGNTRSSRLGLTRKRPVHPRTRGEHFPALNATTTDAGSSPHARGTHTRPLPFPGCGGSSPHARGTRIAGPLRERVLRFIPARAGNTGRTRCRTYP